MVRVSNFLVGTLNAISLVASLMVIGGAAYSRVHGASECQRVAQTPLLAAGLLLLTVSLLGLAGSACGLPWVLWVYLSVIFLLILGLLCFTVFSIVVTNKGVGKWVSGRGVMEYRTGDYARWLQTHMANARNWDKIKSCMNDAGVCSRMPPGDATSPSYFQLLTPMQSGCCKPPVYCKFKCVNATFWQAPGPGRMAVEDSDCRTWSNELRELCYECNACKGGVLAEIKRRWRRVAVFNTALMALLIAVYSLGCCAFRSGRYDRTYRRYRGNP